MTTNTPSNGSASKWAFWKRQDITRGNNALYLQRFILFRCPWFGIYLHKFVSDDDPCLHDHPFPYLAVILWGGYFEWARHKKGGDITPRWCGPGSFLFRRATWAHRTTLMIKRDSDAKIYLKPAYTLFITGPRWWDWFFHTVNGLIPWRQYRPGEHCNE